MSITEEQKVRIKAAAEKLVRSRVTNLYPDHTVEIKLTLDIITRPPLTHPDAYLEQIFSHENIDTKDKPRLKHQVTMMRNALEKFFNDDRWGYSQEADWETVTAEEFLEHITYIQLFRYPHIGRNGIELLRITLEEKGFDARVLKRPTGC